MYFISYKCVVGEVGSYCQLAVIFFFPFFLVSPYQTRDGVVPQFIFYPPPFYKSGSALVTCSRVDESYFLCQETEN